MAVDGERSRDRHPDNTIFWRLSALEEALKYQYGQLSELRRELEHMPERLERQFPTQLVLQRDYVAKVDVKDAAGSQRDSWTLRFIAIGLMLNLVGVAATIIHSFG